MLLFLSVCVLILSRLRLITARVSLDPNEGWNAFQAQAAHDLATLYPPAGSFVANNYPPLSFILIRKLTPPAADLIVTGRIVSLASLLTIAAITYLATRRLAGPRKDCAVLAALIFLVFNVTVFRGYLAMDDPEWLGLAMLSAGLLLLLWDKPAARIPLPRILASALLMLAGVTVKHNIVALPAAAGFWLLRYDLRAFAVWALAGLLALIGVVWLNGAVFDGHMIAAILSPPRTYSALRMLGHGALSLLFVPLIGAGIALFRGQTDDPRLRLLALGSGLSLALGVIQGSGTGVDVNAYFEALIFISIACAVGIARAAQPETGFKMALVTLLLLLPWGIGTAAAELATAPRSIASSRAMINRVAAIRGPVACETLALCYWAGKTFELDFFAYSQVLATGRDHGAFLSALNARRFAGIELDESRSAHDPTPMRVMIISRYRPSYVQRDRTLFQSP